MTIIKLLAAIGAGIAAAELTKPQQAAFFNAVKSEGIDITDTIETQVMNESLPRGIRNNNPTNIRYDGTTWQGMDNPPSDGAFCRFIDARYGIRAAVKILKSYQARGLTSIRQIISTWAPSTENDTQSYINHVAFSLDWLADTPLPQEKWAELISAIIKHENGEQPYTMAAINEGVSWA